LPEYVRIRVRYFADGVVLGSREFVGGIIEAYRDRFGSKKKQSAHQIRRLESAKVYSLRNLAKDLFG